MQCHFELINGLIILICQIILFVLQSLVLLLALLICSQFLQSVQSVTFVTNNVTLDAVDHDAQMQISYAMLFKVILLKIYFALTVI